jgi:hypothetical protein
VYLLWQLLVDNVNVIIANTNEHGIILELVPIALLQAARNNATKDGRLTIILRKHMKRKDKKLN